MAFFTCHSKCRKTSLSIFCTTVWTKDIENFNWQIWPHNLTHFRLVMIAVACAVPFSPRACSTTSARGATSSTSTSSRTRALCRRTKLSSVLARISSGTSFAWCNHHGWSYSYSSFLGQQLSHLKKYCYVIKVFITNIIVLQYLKFLN